MAYTARIIRKEKEDGLLRITVEYTNGVDIVRQNIQLNTVPDTDWLKRKIKNRIQELESLDTYVDSVEVGAVDVSGVGITIDPSDSEASIFQRDYYLLDKMKRAVEIGIIEATNTNLVALETKLKLQLQKHPDYIELI